MFILYVLCKSLIHYAYFIYGYDPMKVAHPKKKTPQSQKKTLAQLEKIEEGGEEEDEENDDQESTNRFPEGGEA
jgi:hypothetical protein